MFSNLFSIRSAVAVLCLSFYTYAFVDLYETCDWKNDSFTQRILDEAERTYSIDKGILAQCNHSQNNLDVSDQIQNFTNILEETQQTNTNNVEYLSKSDIPEVCFFASTLRGAALYPAVKDKKSYYYCKSSNSEDLLSQMEFNHCQYDGDKLLSCQLNESSHQETEHTESNRKPCLDERY